MLHYVAGTSPVQSEGDKPHHLLAGTNLVNDRSGPCIAKLRDFPGNRRVRYCRRRVENVRNAYVGVPAKFG
jgi:hypothetical protein